jgi:hypothetical protein
VDLHHIIEFAGVRAIHISRLCRHIQYILYHDKPCLGHHCSKKCDGLAPDEASGKA